MPRKYTPYEPDQLDCNTIETSLGSDFGVLARVTVSFGRDEVLTICKCFKPIIGIEEEVLVQAIHRVALRGVKGSWTGIYAVMLDCWHQLDRGAHRLNDGIVMRGWDGRPQKPRRSNAE